jgi:hypothetical protein
LESVRRITVKLAELLLEIGKMYTRITSRKCEITPFVGCKSNPGYYHAHPVPSRYFYSVKIRGDFGKVGP